MTLYVSETNHFGHGVIKWFWETPLGYYLHAVVALLIFVPLMVLLFLGLYAWAMLCYVQDRLRQRNVRRNRQKTMVPK